jgi:hypothetical protein
MSVALPSPRLRTTRLSRRHIRRCSRDRRYSIISSARASKDGGTVRRYSADYIRDALWPRRPVTVPTPVPVAMRGSAPVQFRLSAMHR